MWGVRFGIIRGSLGVLKQEVRFLSLSVTAKDDYS